MFCSHTKIAVASKDHNVNETIHVCSLNISKASPYMTPLDCSLHRGEKLRMARCTYFPDTFVIEHAHRRRESRLQRDPTRNNNKELGFHCSNRQQHFSGLLLNGCRKGAFVSLLNEFLCVK